MKNLVIFSVLSILVLLVNIQVNMNYGQGNNELANIAKVSDLLRALIEESFGTEANELIDYIRKHRRELAELSEAHTRAVYGLVEFGRRESGILLKIAKDILSVLKDLEVKIFGEKV